MPHPEYRRDIDGLRAVAILLVLLFHGGFRCPGGFVGVDVFFVISGYLITGIVLTKRQARTFRLSDFWARRIRRLVPASTCLVAAMLAIGAAFLLPSDYEGLARSAVAQQLLMSNFYFWQDSGYFAHAAEFKPLLHTWSLAVEEQFYLVYPVLLVCLSRFRAGIIAVALTVFAVASLASCEWLMPSQPSAAFYLLPTRAWELLLGGIVSLAPAPRWLRPAYAEAVSWSGLLAIGITACYFTSTTHFPGVTALVPCLGAAAIIFSNSAKLTSVGRLMALRPLVFIGLISYSLYLWHWPVLVLTRFWLGGALPVSGRVVAMILSFAIAYLSWRYVECPFRKVRPQPMVLTTYGKLACATAAMLAVCCLVLNSSGWPERLPAGFPAIQARAASGPEGSADGDRINRLPMIGDVDNGAAAPQFIVWGDSHAGVLADVCDQAARRHHITGAFATKGGFVPLLGVWRDARRELPIAQWNEMVLDYIERNHIPNVVLIGAWSVYTEGPADNQIRDAESGQASNAEARAAFTRAAERTVDELAALDANVWIIGQCPDYANHQLPRPLNLYEVWFGLPANRHLSIKEHRWRQAHVEKAFSRLVTSNIHFVDAVPYCFDARGQSLIADGTTYFYTDRNHVTEAGAVRFFSQSLDDIFFNMSRENYERPEVIYAAERPAGAVAR